MIDLRSDTLSQPTEQMRKAMYTAEVGDDARTDYTEYGEDPTVRVLEEITCDITGKEAALFCNSGTMANYISLLTTCKRGDKVLLSPNSHIFRDEKAVFIENYFGLLPIFYDENKYGVPDMQSIGMILQNQDIKMLCLENTNNYYGGTCLSRENTEEICGLAKKKEIPIYLDGARIFNASVALSVTVKDLTSSVDSMMFCLSKGLGAPVGSLLCGSVEFIDKARNIRKLLGGSMRQSGIVAAAGIVALRDYNEKLTEDHRKAQLLANRIKLDSFVSIDYQSVQTNIVKIDISRSGLKASEIQEGLFQHGLKVKTISERFLRLTVYADIIEGEINRAASIFNEYMTEKLNPRV